MLKYLISKEKISSLKTISKHGHYKDRQYIAKRINAFSSKNKEQLIMILLDDQIEMISKMLIDYSKEYKSSNKVLEKAISKEKLWMKKKKEKELKREKMSEILKNSSNRKRKFSDGESYQAAKDMLKKPMNTGRWM